MPRTCRNPERLIQITFMHPCPPSPSPANVLYFMARRPKQLLALTAILSAIIYHAQPGQDAVAASRAMAQTETASPAANTQSRNPLPIDVDSWLTRLKSRQLKADPGTQNPFSGTSWQPPPKPEARPPPVPQMPAFPYQVLGVISVGGNLSLALEQGNHAHAVKVGDFIDSFRIDRIGEASFAVFHAPTRMTREYRYDQLPPKASSPPAAGSAQPAGMAGSSATPPGSVMKPPPASASPATPTASPLTPLGGVIMAPSLIESPPSWSRARPYGVPQQ